MAMKDESLIEFVENINDDRIKITDRGRNYWEENPNVHLKSCNDVILSTS